MDGQTSRKIIGNKLQRRLRHAPADAEHRLRQCMRNRQLEGCKLGRQHAFGDYLLDFACLERKVVVELDGGHHADNVQYDNARTNHRERWDYRALRFWNNAVFENIEGVVEVIISALGQRATPSPPNPPLEGEG